MRDASSADAAALHIYISPFRKMTDAELERAAEIIIRHFGAEGHPAVLVFHNKERRNGSGSRHAHLVLGRVSPEGGVIESGFEKIKVETAARIIEFELDEPAMLGRHHKSIVNWLNNHGREDVADWLVGYHGNNPEKPISAASPRKRRKLDRIGIDLSLVRTEIREAWKTGGTNAVKKAGYQISKGTKSGILIVSKDGDEIGSLNRLVGNSYANHQQHVDASSNYSKETA
jgi:hypothetical protein